MLKWFKSFSKKPDPFAPDSVRALTLARQEALEMKHPSVGTEHVVLGLIRLGTGVAFNVLVKQGVYSDGVRDEIRKSIGVRQPVQSAGNVPFTPRVKKTLALAMREAKALGHPCAGTEHILLALLSGNGGGAARIFARFNIGPAATREMILKELNPSVVAPDDAKKE